MMHGSSLVLLLLLPGTLALAGEPPGADNTFTDLVGVEVVVTLHDDGREVVGGRKDDDEPESVTAVLVRVSADAVVLRVGDREEAIPRGKVWSIKRATSATADDAGDQPAGVPDANWKVMLEREVDVTVANQKHVRGKLVGADGDTATVIRPDGKIVNIKKAEARDLAAQVSRAASAAVGSDLDVASELDRHQARQQLQYLEDSLQGTQDIAWIGPVLTVGGILGTIGGGGSAAIGAYLGRGDILYGGAAVGLTGVGALLTGLFYWWFNGASQDELEKQITKARLRAASAASAASLSFARGDEEKHHAL